MYVKKKKIKKIKKKKNNKSQERSKPKVNKNLKFRFAKH